MPHLGAYSTGGSKKKKKRGNAVAEAFKPITARAAKLRKEAKEKAKKKKKK